MKSVGVALIALAFISSVSAARADEFKVTFKDYGGTVQTQNAWQNPQGVHFWGWYKPSGIGTPFMRWGSGGSYWNALTKPAHTQGEQMHWVVSWIKCGHEIEYQAFLLSGNLVKFGEQKTFTTQPCDRSAAAAEGMPL